MKPDIFITIALCLTFSSCYEDPKLVKQRGEQNVQIAKLRGELALVEERLKDFPPDKSKELQAARKETEKLERNREQLSGEISKLETELRKIQQDYDNYKRKYVVK